MASTAIALQPVAPSGCVMDARDVQHRVEQLMAAQTAHGVVYLRGESLPSHLRQQAGLQGEGNGFSLAGLMRIVTEMAGDGPTLYVCFTVPEPLCNQVMQFNASSKTLQSCSHKLNPSALTVKFPAHEAYEHIMAQASAGRPALNLQ